MKYIYNKERDRLDRLSWNPFFFKATYVDVLTQSERTDVFISPSSNESQKQSIAERFILAGENITAICPVRQCELERWLLQGTPFLEIGEDKIPVSYVVSFLIAEKGGVGGRLSEERNLLLTREPNLLRKIAESYELSKPSHDIVRITEDVTEDVER